MFLRGFLAGIACAGATWYGIYLQVKNDASSSIYIEYQEPSLKGSSKENKDLFKYGTPLQAPSVSFYTNHALSYNWEKRIPHWVIEMMDSKKLQGSANRQKSNFKPDPFVLKLFSAQNEDYSKSGWSRGHMAAAGNHKYDQRAMDDTFFLSNIVPQDIDNNAGFWNRFEMYCRDLTKKFDKVWVVSGPIFLSTEEGGKHFVKYEVIGKSEVAVPTHLYKVILTETGDILNLSAFIVPNKPISKNKNLQEFKVPIEHLESKSGLAFFPQLPRGRTQDLCKVDGCQMIAWETFELYFILRKMESARNISRLEKAFAEVAQKKLTPDDALMQVYARKRDELLAAEKSEIADRTKG